MLKKIEHKEHSLINDFIIFMAKLFVFRKLNSVMWKKIANIVNSFHNYTTKGYKLKKEDIVFHFFIKYVECKVINIS